MPDISQEQFVIMEELESRKKLPETHAQILADARAGTINVKEPDTDLRGLTNVIKNSPVEDMTEGEMQAASQMWTKRVYGTEDTKMIYGRNKSTPDVYRSVQRMIDPTLHKDLMNDVEKISAMSPAELITEARDRGHVGFVEGITGLDFNTGSGSNEEIKAKAAQQKQVLEGLGIPSTLNGVPLFTMTPDQKAELSVRKLKEDALKNSYTSMRSLYEQGISDAGVAYAREIASGKEWNASIFTALSESDKALIPSYIQLVKKPIEGAFSGTAVRVATGFKDMGDGAVDFIDFNSRTAWHSLWGAEGGQRILKLDEEKDALKAERKSLRNKFNDPTVIQNIFGDAAATKFVDKGLGQVADSIPLMLSLAVAGKIRAVSWGASLIAAGVPTAAIAQDIESSMIERGVDRDISGLMALPTAVLTVAVEKMALDNLINIPKAQFIGMATDAMMKNSMRVLAKKGAFVGGNFLLRSGSIVANEVTEEIIQSTLQEISTQAGLGKADIQKIFDIAGETLEESLPAAVVFGAGGAGGGLVSDTIKQSTAAENLERFNQVRDYSESFADSVFEKDEITEGEKSGAFFQILDEWTRAETDAERKVILNKNAVVNQEEASRILNLAQSEVKAIGDTVKDADPVEIAKKLGVIQEELARVHEEGQELGIDAEVVDGLLTSPTGQLLAAMIQGDQAKVSSLSERPLKELYHEVGHNLEDLGKFGEDSLTTGEVKILGDVISTKFDENQAAALYNDLDNPGQLSEATVEAFAELNTQEQTIVQKFRNILSRIWNFLKGRGFKSASDIMQRIMSERREDVKQSRATAAELEVNRQKATSQRESLIRQSRRFKELEAENERQKERLRQEPVEPVTPQVTPKQALDQLHNGERIQKDQRIPKESRLVVGDSDLFAAQLIASELRKNPKITREKLAAKVQDVGFDANMEIAFEEALDTVFQEGEQIRSMTDRIAQVANIVGKTKQRHIQAVVKQAIKTGRQQEKTSAAAKQKGARGKQKRRSSKERSEVVQARAVENVPIVAFDRLDSIKQSVRDDMESRGFDTKDGFNESYRKTIIGAVADITRELKMTASRSEINSIMNKLQIGASEAKIDAAFTQAMKKLDQIQEVAERKNLIKEFNALLAMKPKHKISSPLVASQRKLGQATHRWLQMVSISSKMSQPQVDKNLTNIEKYLETQSEVIDSDEAERLRNGFIDDFPILKDASWGDTDFDTRLRSMYNAISKYGALKLSNKQFIAEASIQLAEDIIKGQVQAQKLALEQAQQSKKVRKGYTKALTDTKGKKTFIDDLTDVFLPALSLWDRISDLGRFSSPAGREQLAQAQDATAVLVAEGDTRKGTTVREGMEWLSDTVTDIYGTKNMSKIVERLTRTNAAWTKFDKRKGEASRATTVSRMLQIIGSWEQREAVKGMKQQGYTQGIINEMKQALTDDDLLLLAEIRKFYAEFADRLNKTSQQVFGTNVAASAPNFIPIRRIKQSGWTGNDAHVPPIRPKGLVERTKNDNPIDTEFGILEMFTDRLSENANYIGHAETTILMRSIFNAELADRIKKTNGEKALRGIFNQLSDVVTSPSDSYKSAVWDKIRGWVGLTALAGNIKVTLTQQLSAFAYPLATEGHLLNFPKLINQGLLHPQAWKTSVDAIINSEQWKNRKKTGTSEDVANALTQSFGDGGVLNQIPNDTAKISLRTVRNAIANIYRRGMLTNQWGDSGGILSVSPMVHMEQLNIAKEQGHTNPEKIAMTRTWNIIERTQQSFKPKDQATWIRRGGIFGRLLAQFSSTPAQYLSFEVQALREVIASKGKEGKRKALNIIAINHVLLGGGYFFLSQFFTNLLTGEEWEEEDSWRLLASILAGPASGLVIFGSVMQSFFEFALTGKKSSFFRSVVPLERYIEQTPEVAYELIKHMTWDFDLDEALNDTLELMENFVVPVRHIRTAATDKKKGK